MAEAAETQPNTDYTFVDDIPLVAEARYAERVRAGAILDAREYGASLSLEEQQLVPIDALSTADRVHEAARRHGRGSPDCLQLLEGLEQDCQRLVAEWYRKLRPEWFPAARHQYDPTRQAFFSHGMSVRQMTENALQPIPNDPEEQARRVNERVEDETLNIIRGIGGIALNGVAMRTISECTDKAIDDYDRDIEAGNKHRGYGGYVPERQKLAIRDIRLDEATGERIEEPVLLPGELITGSIIRIALQRRGLQAGHLDKTALHGAQFLTRDSLTDFVALLDTVAGEEWCTNVFMGEEVAADYVKDYSGFRQEAMRRQEDQRDMARTIANFVLDLAADNVDRRKAPQMVEGFVKKMLLDLGKQNPKAAEDMFNKETAIGLQEVARFEAAGRFAEAYTKMQEVEKAAPGGGYCGAGSCGIERFNENSTEGEEIKEKLKAESGDTVVKDTERTCKHCHKKGGLFYAYNPTKVNKLCTSCGATESKRTAFRA